METVISVLAVIILIAFVAFAWSWSGRRLSELTRTYVLSELRIPIDLLLRKGMGGSFIKISEQESGLWVQFRKYFDADEAGAIEISFPRAPWTLPYFSKLEMVLKRHSILFSIKREIPSQPMEFLYIDCGKDVDRAERSVSLIFTEVFGVSPDSSFTVQGYAIAAFGNDIEHSSQQPTTWRQLVNLFRNRDV